MSRHRIERLGHLGDGIAEGPVHAPLTLPGETVEGRLEGTRLADIRIVTPSSDRVTPPCRHFRACGGCRLQHAEDGFVAEWKMEQVRTALAAQGITAEIARIETSPRRSRRRATFAARRTKKGAMAGFHGRASGEIAEIPDCTLLHPELMAALPAARDLALAGGSRKAVLDVASTLCENGIDIRAEGGKPLDGPLRQNLADIAARHDLARLSWADEVVVARRAPILKIGRAMVTPPPGAFLQATAEGAASLLSQMRRITDGAKRVVDLFAGCGTFALPLAETAHVHAVEADAGMLSALDHGWRHAQGLKPVTCEKRDLFREPLTAAELANHDAAVIDPPRAGAAAQTAELAESRISTIAFASCNPVTFARDARRLLESGYVAGPIVVVDQFRWSAHVELVAEFRYTPA